MMKRKICDCLMVVMLGCAIGAVICGNLAREQESETTVEVIQPIQEDKGEVIQEEEEINTFVKDEDIPYQEIFYKYSQQYGISEELLEAIAFTESSYRTDCVSDDGSCMGLMQVSKVHKDIWESLDLTEADMFTAEGNIEVACVYLVSLFETYDGDLNLVLAHYNGHKAYYTRETEFSPYAERVCTLAESLERKHGK